MVIRGLTFSEHQTTDAMQQMCQAEAVEQTVFRTLLFVVVQ